METNKIQKFYFDPRVKTYKKIYLYGRHPNDERNIEGIERFLKSNPGAEVIYLDPDKDIPKEDINNNPDACILFYDRLPAHIEHEMKSHQRQWAENIISDKLKHSMDEIEFAESILQIDKV